MSQITDDKLPVVPNVYAGEQNKATDAVTTTDTGMGSSKVDDIPFDDHQDDITILC